MTAKVLISSLNQELKVLEEEQTILLRGVPLMYVWVQGRVVDRPNPREFILDDGTGQIGVAVITDLISLDDAKIGNYIMVPKGIITVGEVEATKQIIMYLEAKLVMMPSEDQVESLEKMWPIEVEECWKLKLSLM